MDTTTAPATADRNKVGMATLVAGAAFVIAALGSAALEELWILMLIGFALLIYAVPALHRHQAPADGPLGHWGARLVLFGGAVVVALGIVFLIWEAVGTPPEDPPGPVGILWAIGFLSFVVGVVLFRIGTLQAGVFLRDAAALMLGGLLGALLIDMATGAFFEDDAAATTEWGLYIGVPLFGLGLGWIGYTLWSQTRDSAPRTGAPAPTA